MKNLHLLLIAFIAPVLAFSAPQVAKLTVVEGHVYNHNASPESKTIIVNIPDISGWIKNTVYFTQVDKNDNFKITFKLYVAQDAQLLQEGLSTQPLIQDFIIHPGDKIHINLDFKTLTNISFSGSAAKTNNNLFDYLTHYVNFRTEIERTHLYNVHEADKYKDAVHNLLDELTRRTTDFETKVKANEETQTWLDNNLKIYAYNSFASRYISDNRYAVDQTQLSAYTSLKPEDINTFFNPRLINAEAYKLLHVLLPKHTNDDLYAQYSPQFIAMIDDTAKKYNNQLLGDLLRGAALHVTIAEANTADFYKNKAVFDGIKAPYLKVALARRYKVQKFDNNVKQKMVSSFNQRLAGTPAGKVIDSLIAAHKNQVIYVDVWATWCGPCIGEMPNSKKMAEKYQGKNVAFAYICTYSPKEEWETVSAKLGSGR